MTLNNLQDFFVLKNGVKVPCVALGTWQMRGDVCKKAVMCAIESGYRHIDTASAYQNEKEIGEAILESGIARDELFITSKVWNDARGYESTLRAFDESLARLGLDYLDLYLIHWPASHTRYEDWQSINLSTWRALCELYRSGRVRAIGVSNFKEHHLRALLSSEIPPMVNQIELHPGQLDMSTLEVCRENGILVEAWSPLGEGKLLNDPSLCDIASKYGVSVAQLCIRWCLQNHTLPLPKSKNPHRIAENLQVLDFELSPEDMQKISAMEHLGGSGVDPDDFD